MENYTEFIDSKYLPNKVGQKDMDLVDPMQWKTLQLATFWTFWYDRQTAGKDALRFKMVEGHGKGKMMREDSDKYDDEDDVMQDLGLQKTADGSDVGDAGEGSGETSGEMDRKRKRTDVEEIGDETSSISGTQSKKQRASDGKAASSSSMPTGGEEDGSPAACLKDASSLDDISTRKDAFLTGLCPEEKYQNLVAALQSAPVGFLFFVNFKLTYPFIH